MSTDWTPVCPCCLPACVPIVRRKDLDYTIEFNGARPEEWLHASCWRCGSVFARPARDADCIINAREPEVTA